MSNNLELRTITLFKKVLSAKYPNLKLNDLTNEEIIDKTLEVLEGIVEEHEAFEIGGLK